MLQGDQVKEYFEEHPEAKELIECTEVQFKCWQPGLEHKDMYRKLTLDDIVYISFQGWCGEDGTFAWYYPGGVPHYMRIGD